MAKILLVEDNEMNRDMLSRRLQRRGYDVVIAIDGEEGVSMARSDAPDLILMDITLPDVDGFEALLRLRELHETKTTPVVALSGNAMPSDIKKALDAGFANYLTKPLNIDELYQVIANILGTTPQ